MKDRIVRVLDALLALVPPSKSGHHAVYRPTVSPSRARGLQQSLRSPWLAPWPGPSRETVSQRWADDERSMTIPLRTVPGNLRQVHAPDPLRARFEWRRYFDRTAYGDELDPRHERQKALSAGASGYDYPYEYPGAPFPASAIGGL